MAAQALDLAIIGNCSIAALIDRSGDIVWACMPCFDGDPVFCSLLNPDQGPEGFGYFNVDLLDRVDVRQGYLSNTAIVQTCLYDKHGGGIEILDYAPRFRRYGRYFHPMMIVRQIKALSGSPRIQVKLRPAYGYGKHRPAVTWGSNHIRYVSPDLVIRLTTNAAISAILDEVPFLLDQAITFLFGPDETVQKGIPEVGRELFEETQSYWQEWVRYLGIPFEWQEAVIRAAITLKLNAYDDTGAIIAAVTTSIPEAPDSGRNWDYRYCWLRDGYFVVNALNRLGTTLTMERYLRFIINVAAIQQSNRLQPVYRINGQTHLAERVVDSLTGFRGMGPVRVGNQAYAQSQHDVYGSAVLAATHVFFDRRLSRPGDHALFQRLESLGVAALAVFGQPDAGLWELRSSLRVHTFSQVMCWAACDRLSKIAHRLGAGERARYWREHADRLHAIICGRAWNAGQRSFVTSFDGTDVDASLLLLHELNFLAVDDPRYRATVANIERRLRRGRYIFRYAEADDFGTPTTSFLVCSFWYVDALAALGRIDEARELFETLLAARNCHGLLSEDVNPDTGELWGNIAQTYSMVGLINSAMRLSRSWEDAF